LFFIEFLFVISEYFYELFQYQSLLITNLFFFQIMALILEYFFLNFIHQIFQQTSGDEACFVVKDLSKFNSLDEEFNFLNYFKKDYHLI
jgi:hypothetical protein